MFDLDSIVRQNIKDLKPYSSARNEYSGTEAIFLDANENPYNTPYNRYPDPLHKELRDEIANIKGVNSSQIFLGNGSDEAIDLIFRAFCDPGKDNMVTIDPTYDMYSVCAHINGIRVIKVPLLPDFRLDVENILYSVNSQTKAIFLCSPNNPTANCFSKENMIEIISRFDGIVVIDEAYIDFAPGKTMLPFLKDYPNLVILQTFSKAWGMAGIRLGMAFASKEIIEVFNKIKYPYNVNNLTAKVALEGLTNIKRKEEWVKQLLTDREELKNALIELPVINEVLPSDSNFLIIRVNNAKEIYDYLKNKKIIIRDRSKVTLCEGCLRVTIGKQSENLLLINALKDYQNNRNE